MKQNTRGTSAPWWRFGFVWMVFAGPALAVLASLITAYIAVTSSPNELVSEDNFRKGDQMNSTVSDAERAASMAPALKARNHAQTGVPPTTLNSVPKP